MEFNVNRPATNDNDSSHKAAFDRLPPHLQAGIFQHFGLVERMKLRLVSQSWNEVTLDSTQLALTIDASEFKSEDNSQIFALFVLRQKTGCFINGVDCSGTSPNELFNRLPQPLMNRVFKIGIALGAECNEATGLLSELASRIERTCTLTLAFARLPLSVFTSTQQANATFAEEFPSLQLEELFIIDCDFNETGNNPLSYFRGDNAAKRCKTVHLSIRARPSDVLLALITEGYPSTTRLVFDFYNPVDGSNISANNNQQPLPNPPDWPRLTQLRSLRDMTILATKDAGIQLPVLSAERRFGQLTSLSSFNAVLPPTSDFFRFTPKLERMELTRNHGDHSHLEVRQIAMDIRSGHLKKLKFAKFDIESPAQEASFDSLQLFLKAIVEGSSTTEEPITVCWSEFDTVSANNQRGLVDLLNQLPAGFFNRRPVLLKLAVSDIRRLSSIGAVDGIEERLPQIIGAMHRSGLQKLTLRCWFDAEGFPQAVQIGLLNTPELEGQEVVRICASNPADKDEEGDLQTSFTPAQQRGFSMVFEVVWQVNGREQKLKMLQFRD